MRFEDLNWFDIENYLKRDDRLIMVIGACEQHAYLSLLTDIKIPLALADSASQKTGVVVAPPLNFGCSKYFEAYPGTLSLRVSTMLDVVEDLVVSAYKQCFKKILIINGHGGNDPARSRLFELVDRFPDLRIRWYSWWLSHSVETVAMKYGLKPAHANWLEAFSFTRVSELPTQEKKPPVHPGIVCPKVARNVYGDGSFGGAYQTDEMVMVEIFQACLLDIIQLLDFET